MHELRQHQRLQLSKSVRFWLSVFARVERAPSPAAFDFAFVGLLLMLLLILYLILFLPLGGAAVHRCDNQLILGRLRR
jgi:threonine/homoserine/homoserine lactone efflux protein